MMTTAASSMTPSDIDSSPLLKVASIGGAGRAIKANKNGGPMRRAATCLRDRRRSGRQHEDPIGDKHYDQARRQSEIGQHARFALTQIAFLESKIGQRLRRKLSAILHIVAEGEDRNDQGRQHEADPECRGVTPYFGASAEKQRVHESEHRIESDQPIRCLPWPFDVT